MCQFGNVPMMRAPNRKCLPLPRIIGTLANCSSVVEVQLQPFLQLPDQWVLFRQFEELIFR